MLEKGELVWCAVESTKLDDTALVTITAAKLSAVMDSVLLNFQRNQLGEISYSLNIDSQPELLKRLSAYHLPMRLTRILAGFMTRIPVAPLM